jgi:AAHS family 4-hydroxybenzoate transporter-like MFS transporter
MDQRTTIFSSDRVSQVRYEAPVEVGRIIDVGRLIDDAPWSVAQKLILCLISLAFIVDSLANNVLAIAIPALIRDWHVKRADFSSVIAVGWVGVAFGSILAGWLSDRLGRKTLLLASILVFGLATAGAGLVTNRHQLLLLRAIDGFGIGGAIPCATTLLAEFTPTRRRSRAVIIGMISMPVGTLVGGILGSAVLPTLGWRALFALNAALAIIVGAVLLLLVPESPRFLSRMPARHKELMRGLKRLKIDVPADARCAETQARTAGGSLSALFGGGSLSMTLGLWGGFFFCLLASYSSLNWMPSLLSNHGYSLRVSSLALSASGVGGILASIVTARLVERFGSRGALIFPTVLAIISATALSLLPLDPARSAIPVLLAISTMGLSLNSLTNLVYALGAFIYPPLVKGTGLGAAATVGRIGAITSSYSAVAALNISSDAYFGFIAATAVISMLFLLAIRRQIPSDKAFDAART